MDSCSINAAGATSLDVLDEVFGEASVVFYTAAGEGDFALRYVSRNIGRVLGVPPEFCVEPAAFWRERIHAEDAGRVLCEFVGLAATGCVTQEFRFRDDLNNYRWVSNEVSFKRDANGAAAYLAGCLRDISAAKDCAAKFSDSLQEQSAREHFYRSVLDSLPQRLFWKDRNSLFRGCNLSGARALNLSSTSAIVGKTDYDFYSDREEADYLRTIDERVMDSGRASFHTEVSSREHNTWLDVSKVPLRDMGGDIYGLLVSYEDVSALKKSEMALHKFKRAVEQSPNSVFIADTAGNIEYANPSFFNTYGYERHEVLGMNMDMLRTGLVSPEGYPGMLRAVSSGKNWSGELAKHSSGGEICWQACSFSPIFDENGKIIHFLSIENDITERKRMEEALAENEARLREITSTIGEGIYVVDTDNLVSFVNPAAAKLFGCSEQEVLGQDACNLCGCFLQNDQHGADVEPGCLLDGIRQTCNVVYSDNEYFIRSDGIQFPVSAIATPILRDGRYAGAVVAFHDITEQKFTQRLLNDTLRELRAVLDNAQIGVAYLREGKFFWINKHMEQMFGYVVGGLIGEPMETIYAIGEDGSDGEGSKVSDFLAGGGVYETERLMRRCSGETFWCHQRGVAIDPDNPGKGSIWIMLDIDRLKTTESNLKTLNETLAQRVDEETQKTLERERLFIQQGRNAAMGEMIGNIAHQWRQPLSTLGLVVQNIQADFQEKALSVSALEEYVETATRAIQRMSCTIDDFRDFFRPNRAKERFSIYQSIYGTLQLLDAMLKNNGIAIRLTGDQELKVLGHSNEFSQAVLNFLVNAKDALVDRKVPQGRIDIELAGYDGWGVVTIRDNAGGIQDDELEKIFDPYFTTKPKGTGIGLHMNKTIIEKHMNGRIVCRNVPEGAEFSIIVPLAHDDTPVKDSEVENDRY